ncbi:MAG: hypothetical protein QOD26_2172 [Betaproteobacteria bacterium]|nr:hypothetical protein [Betaproteobacteria bacterium]
MKALRIFLQVLIAFAALVGLAALVGGPRKARGWILRLRRSRAVNITPKGTEGFAKLFASLPR